MKQGSKITIHLGEPSMVIDIELIDPKFLKHELNHVRSLLTNRDQFISVCTEMLRSKKQIEQNLHNNEPISLPQWMYLSNQDVMNRIGFILYYANRPLTIQEITEAMNSFKKIDLRNVSKHLTRTSRLFEYSFYDNNTKVYGLNDQGKNWIEKDLMMKISPNKNSTKRKSNSTADSKVAKKKPNSFKPLLSI